MRFRHKVSRSKSKRVFHKTAKRVHKRNMRKTMARGGTRL